MSEDESIRIMFLTKPSCGPCEPAKQAIKQAVGQSFFDKFVISEVDVTQNPPILARYNVMHVPAIVINDRKIEVHDFNDVDEIQQLLMTEVVNSIIRRDRVETVIKQNTVIHTTHFFDSVINQKLIRPNLGDYCHLGLVHQTTMALVSLDPLISEILYRAGKDVGHFGPSNNFVLMQNPNLASAVRVNERFWEVIQGIIALFSKQQVVPLYKAEDAEVIEFDRDRAVLRLKGLATAPRGVNAGIKFCNFFAGEIAGIVEVLLACTCHVRETKCSGESAENEYCEFELIIGETIPFDLTSDDISQQLSDEYMETHTKTMDDSITMRRIMRPVVGDHVHFSVLQQPLVSFVARPHW